MAQRESSIKRMSNGGIDGQVGGWVSRWVDGYQFTQLSKSELYIPELKDFM